MKIGFFSEAGYNGKISRDITNIRTDSAWSCALNATHHCVFQLDNVNSNYDIGVCIIPKERNRKELVKHNYPLIEKLKSICNKVLVIQESTHWDWQEADFDIMVWYYNQLVLSDGVLCHNDIDAVYFRGITDKPSFVFPTLIIEDKIKVSDVKTDSVFVAGNWHTTYRGFDAWVIAQEFGLSMSGFKSGKFKVGEEQNGINYLPWMDWVEFMFELSKHKYGVQCYQASAGQFPLNCAYLGIPCIGYDDINTQRDLFPQLSVNRGDIVSARKLALKLKKDGEFYSECSLKAIDNYNNMYKENIFLKKWKKIVEALNI